MTSPSNPHDAVGSSLPASPRILVGVCTFNEAGNVRELLQQITAALPSADVIVVDDNSPDGTAAAVRQYASSCHGSTQIRCHVRQQRGLGGAIRAAMTEAIEGDYDLFCNLDGDLSHNPADLPRLVAAVQAGADVAVGSRYVAGGEIVGWPLRRKWMSRCINAVTRRRLRLPVRDASGSFRCYRVSKLAELDLSDESYEGYAFIQEVLMRLFHAGAQFTEVPITFTERVRGESKLSFREAIRSGWTVFQLK
ncbi:polyprenol monophosphomannose synthase [Allorhodopirellula solitaria]|uniref:Undecaprenyl-phosphate mannosyltransferase n=1 Tax=Allorhodopirellula solitaria TaxID=2527987 RepID=A0A5C5Y001_9BACT|nr:polyprenol monophosphomannose synthase [Allorhodopirellula solitaria]TWT67535.1 Undecaprenyl-phosphate mannosyltransferase [Allorhodopirellula solitaria]